MNQSFAIKLLTFKILFSVVQIILWKCFGLMSISNSNIKILYLKKKLLNLILNKKAMDWLL